MPNECGTRAAAGAGHTAVRRVQDTSFLAAVCTRLTQAIPTASGGQFSAWAGKERSGSVIAG